VRAWAAGHTTDSVGSVTELNGGPQVFYYDATAHALRHAWWTETQWQSETLDGAGSIIAGHTSHRVGTAINVSPQLS
jgi:hypothetical protein